MAKSRFVTFFAWQSDLPEKCNAQLIRNAILKSAAIIGRNDALEVTVVPDEATRDRAGSPNIVDSILKKIREADCFICDVTRLTSFEGAPLCNANVSFELGYAVRELGWDRVVLVFNTAFGSLPADLPFDLQHQRTMSYSCKLASNSKAKKTKADGEVLSNAEGRLTAELSNAIKMIITKKPKKPRELENLSPTEIHRQRDVSQLQDVFYYLHLPTMEHLFDRIGYSYIPTDAYFLFLGLQNVINSSAFHLYDKQLKTRVVQLLAALAKCFRYLGEMEPNRSGREYTFHMPGDMATSNNQLKACKETALAGPDANLAFDKLLKYVREKYLEIDPRSTGREALATIRSYDKS